MVSKMNFFFITNAINLHNYMFSLWTLGNKEMKKKKMRCKERKTFLMLPNEPIKEESEDENVE